MQSSVTAPPPSLPPAIPSLLLSLFHAHRRTHSHKHTVSKKAHRLGGGARPPPSPGHTLFNIELFIKSDWFLLMVAMMRTNGLCVRLCVRAYKCVCDEGGLWL